VEQEEQQHTFYARAPTAYLYVEQLPLHIRELLAKLWVTVKIRFVLLLAGHAQLP
jgi:hypothetical protein